MNIYVDIDHSFIRQPIKLAISNYLQDAVSFVGVEEMAELIIGIPDKQYVKPSILLSDDPHTLISHDTCLSINPVPSNKAEMDTLILKVAEQIGKL